MALSADDRLLGEKTHYYCSSSESEGEDNPPATLTDDRPPVTDYTGQSSNTGPKGVVQDWRRYKQLETEKREQQEREKVELAKRLSVTCRSHFDDEREKAKDAQFLQQLEEELGLDDDFLEEYRLKRLEEMRAAVRNVPKFGTVIGLTKEQFVEAVDKERPTVTVIVHIYNKGVAACDAMSRCLECLAQQYPTVKFCSIRASDASLSIQFSVNAVPALLVYKNKELIGNFIRLSDELGDDFMPTDVESFLIEHGMLSEESQSAIRTSVASHYDSDSD